MKPPPKVMTKMNSLTSFFRPHSAVPFAALKLFLQVLQRQRPALGLWIEIFPAPTLPLSQQARLGQNCSWGSFDILLAHT